MKTVTYTIKKFDSIDLETYPIKDKGMSSFISLTASIMVKDRKTEYLLEYDTLKNSIKDTINNFFFRFNPSFSFSEDANTFSFTVPVAEVEESTEYFCCGFVGKKTGNVYTAENGQTIFLFNILDYFSNIFSKGRLIYPVSKKAIYIPVKDILFPSLKHCLHAIQMYKMTNLPKDFIRNAFLPTGFIQSLLIKSEELDTVRLLNSVHEAVKSLVISISHLTYNIFLTLNLYRELGIIDLTEEQEELSHNVATNISVYRDNKYGGYDPQFDINSEGREVSTTYIERNPAFTLSCIKSQTRYSTYNANISPEILFSPVYNVIVEMVNSLLDKEPLIMDFENKLKEYFPKLDFHETAKEMKMDYSTFMSTIKKRLLININKSSYEDNKNRLKRFEIDFRSILEYSEQSFRLVYVMLEGD